MDRTMHRAGALVLAAIWMALSPWSVVAQQPQRRVITGDSERLPTADVDLLRIHFEAGARTYWHTHENAQIYLVEAGRGRLQVQGGEILNVDPGEPVFLPPRVPHWHGASPDESATCLQVYPGGVGITMLGEVTEHEYLGRPRARP